MRKRITLLALVLVLSASWASSDTIKNLSDVVSGPGPMDTLVADYVHGPGPMSVSFSA